MRALRLILLLCSAGWRLHAADFEAANQLYEQGKYPEAKMAYERLVAAGEWRANLFYNLGNAEYRLEAPGRAILNYERALALDSAHPEAHANLSLVRGKTGALLWPRTWRDALFPGRSIEVYTALGAIAGWVGLFCLAAIFLGRPQRDKSGLWFGAGFGLLIFGYSVAAVWSLGQDRALAIITVNAAEAHFEPAESSAAASSLTAGSQVRVLSERGDWTYCALPGQGRGWISTHSLERVALGKS
ncbi:MAG: hypothetical protein QOE70_6046 [Chthoniobacter sp.]|jgi:tetratricopeptide (TPR) repeat protein|nr:hypothetical protein [Chthoniobacter sp.]